MKSTRIVLSALTALLVLTFATLSQTPDAVSLGQLELPMGTLTTLGELAYPGALAWYTFEMQDAGTIHIYAQGDASIRALLFDVDFDFIQHSDTGRIAASLDPGTYSIRVDSIASEAVSYELILSNLSLIHI